MPAFLHRIASSGIRPVPVRGRVKVRAVEGHLVRYRRGEAADRRSGEPRHDAHADSSPPPTLSLPPTPDDQPPASTPPSVTVTEAPRLPPAEPPIARPPAGGDAQRVARVPVRAASQDGAAARPAPAPARHADGASSRTAPPLPRVPLLSVEPMPAEIASGEHHLAAPPPLATPVLAPDISAPVQRAPEPPPAPRALRGFHSDVSARRELPLPRLDGRDRPPTAQPGLTAPSLPQPAPAARPEARDRTRTVMVEPAPSAAPPIVASRSAPRQPGGLTIHKLELQIVERPREIAPKPTADAPASRESSGWDWPDRRHAIRVW